MEWALTLIFYTWDFIISGACQDKFHYLVIQISTSLKPSAADMVWSKSWLEQQERLVN